MKIPSEAELIEMERRADAWLDEQDWDWECPARDVLTLVALLRELRAVSK